MYSFTYRKTVEHKLMTDTVYNGDDKEKDNRNSFSSKVYEKKEDRNKGKNEREGGNKGERKGKKGEKTSNLKIYEIL